MDIVNYDFDTSYILNHNNYIEDDCVNVFHTILSRFTPYQCRPMDYLRSIADVPPVPSGQSHLQLLFCGENFSNVGHWVCIFYNGDILRVFDSLGNKSLPPLQQDFIDALFPHKPKISFVEVQRQPNMIDCGVFAIAFATSIALEKNPVFENYIIEQMRPHLVGIIESGELVPFPSTPRKPRGNPRRNIFTMGASAADKKKKLRSTDKTEESDGNVASGFKNDDGDTKSLIKNKAVSKDELRAIDRQKKRISRDNPEVYQRDKERNKLYKKINKTASNRSTKQTQILNTVSRRVTRLNPILREKEQLRDTKSRRNARQDPIYRQNEQLANTLAHKTARQDPVYRENEQLADTLARRTARQDSVNRENEQVADTLAHRTARLDPVYREKEQLADTLAHRTARQDPVYREKEQLADTLARRTARQDSVYRENEQVADTLAHRTARQDPVYREKEQTADNFAHKAARQNSIYRENEQLADTLARRTARQDFVYRNNEQLLTTNRKERNASNWKVVCEKFKSEVLEGHTNVCHCCGRLWHKKSIKSIFKESLKLKSNKYTDEYLHKIFNLCPDAQAGLFCHTCSNNIKEFKIPRLARYNGLTFPVIPDVLKDLTLLEERLVCARHIFIKIVRRGSGLGFQHGLAGNVVNVPVEVNSMVTALPRSCSDNHVITVELKRKMCYKHGRKERIRPNKVRQAARYLVDCPLFKELNIQLDENWDKSNDDDEECTCNLVNVDEIDEERHDKDVNPGGGETLLDQDMTLIMAPGEGKQPMSLAYDKHMEELAFVKIHCGLKREYKEKLSHMEITKSEISREDRRAVRPDYLFTALKKQQVISVKNSITTCFRKKTINGAPILVENILDSTYLDNLVQSDDCYRVLRGIKNSPAHWEAEKKKLLAMVRQFGIPSMFITLSAAETRWPELLKMLKKVVDAEEITLEEADNLPYEVKARLIQCDPYICATYFEIRLQAIRKTWKCTLGPFNSFQIAHFYYRIEFQHRGSPHAHIMLWLKEAPIFKPGDVTTIPAIIKFVDDIISCSSEELEESLWELQRHRHTHTCHPKPGRPCRFGIPFYPMDKTEILTELDKEHPEFKHSKQLGKEIKEKLEQMPSTICSFEQFLEYIGISKAAYILAIRASIPRPMVILKRSPKDIFINPYCKKILQLHRANMDAQYILDPFACSLYIVNYINKADRGMSRLLREAVEEARKGNKGIRESLRAISNTFLNASEISAQEAIYHLLSLAMSRGSESEVFINTNVPEKRVQILKSLKELKSLDPQSTDIFSSNLIDHYTNRPRDAEFEQMTLAYFAAYFMFSKNGNKRGCSSMEQDVIAENELEELQDAELETEQGEGNWIALQKKSGYIRRRKRPRVIRFCRFSRLQDPDQFYREQVMLYRPWRNETIELLDESLDLLGIFNSEIDIIRSNSLPFNRLGGADEFEELLNAIRQAEIKDDEEQPCRGHTNRQPLDDFDYEEQIGDVAQDILPGGNPGPNQGDPVNFVAPPPMPEDDYLELTRKLNLEQRDFLLHILQHFQNSTDSGWTPIYTFLSGGAGVGKSILIKTLYQSLTLLFNRSPGSNPDDIKVLLSAPTGKAAFGIGGQTLHSAFSLPVSQVGHMMPDLSAATSNTMSCKLAQLKLIIIDEISMVGSKTLHQVNRRLQQIFQSRELFGGISVMAVGDLRQLSPVGDNWVFQPVTGKTLATLAGAPLWNLFKLFELVTIMRQRDDLAFATALNNLAAGKMTSDDLKLMNSRCFKLNELPTSSEGAVHLYNSNALVDAHNERVLNAMQTDGALVEAIDDVSGEPNQSAKDRALKSISSLPKTQTYGLPKVLNLKLLARYMITVNVDTEDGLVNGTTGKLRAIDFGINKLTGIRRPLRLWLEFDDPAVGKNKRNFLNIKGNHDQIRIGKKWTPLESVTYTIKKWKASNLQIRRTQFPLVPAEAITVHKSQGATMEKVVIHLNSYIRRAMLYVACSRATTAAGLFIVSDVSFPTPTPPLQSNPVVTEMKRLREDPLKPAFRFLREERPPGLLQVVFHNVQSLRKHSCDIAIDPIVLNSDVVFMAETWSNFQDIFLFDSFTTILRTNGPQTVGANRGYGCMSLVKSNMLTDGRISFMTNFQTTCGRGHCEGIAFDVDGVRLICAYRSPQCNVNTFLDALDHIIFEGNRTIPLPPTVVCGDFNINLTDKENTCTALQKYFDSIDIKSELRQTVTTHGFTHIDHLFSNIQLTAGVYKAFFSYHHPIWFQFNTPIMPEKS